jgi:hypothetical protein
MKLFDFMVDPHLGAMGEPSFRAWHVVARLIDGDAHLLDAGDLALARLITQRDRFPTQPVREFYAGIGRRGGKSRFASVLACWKASADYSDKLARGERAVSAVIATDRSQAGLIFNYARGAITGSPLLAQTLEGETTDSLTLSHGTTLEVHTASLRSTRGRSFACVLLDEAAFLRDAESANPDIELVRAVRPGLITLGGMLAVVSSPYMRRGLLFEAHRKHFGNNDSPALYVSGDSRVFNPTLDNSQIEEAIADDPEGAAAEWRGEFRSDLSAAFAPEWIERAVDVGVFERARVSALPADRGAPHYCGFTDPAGGGGRDSWTAGVAHADGDAAVLDALLEIRPPFSTADAAQQVAQFLKGYGLASVSGDRYAGRWPADALAGHGLQYIESERVRSDIYREAIPLFSAGRVRLIDNARLATQFKLLERRVSPGGRDVIDHGRSGNDDCSNSAAGALVLAATRTHSTGEAYTVRSRIRDDFVGSRHTGGFIRG